MDHDDPHQADPRAARRPRETWFEGGQWIEPRTLGAGEERLARVRTDIERIQAQLSAPYRQDAEGRALPPAELEAWRRRTIGALNAHMEERRRLAAWVQARRGTEHTALSAALRLLQEVRAGRPRPDAIDALLAAQRELTTSPGFEARAEDAIARAANPEAPAVAPRS